MSQEQHGLQDRRGLRFPFSADAEVVSQNPPGNIPARVTELSFRGCYLETSAALKEQQRVHVKISLAEQRFEALAHVMYVRPGGVGLVFVNMETPSRAVLQAWILSAMDTQTKSKRS